ncbi:hypothetical protein AWN76_007335 [Rhodothermaceae bacterium RA]|nr:hypothetical protein AWN76_007335 [Rhodothermaceae bacterium RA]
MARRAVRPARSGGGVGRRAGADDPALAGPAAGGSPRLDRAQPGLARNTPSPARTVVLAGVFRPGRRVLQPECGRDPGHRGPLPEAGPAPPVGRPARLLPHHVPPAAPTAEARKRLGLPVADTVLLHVGFIRPYKNVPHLIRTFRRLPESGMRLLIGGQPATAALRAEIEAAARGDARIALDLGFLPAEQLTDYVAAADLVVLPYAEILNSGTALLALSLNRPVLVPALGALLELRDEVGPAWVQTYTGTLSPEVLRQAATWARDTPRPAEAPLSRRAWPHLARQTVEAYRWLCTR